jgi:PAS domain S-box-containing protein
LRDFEAAEQVQREALAFHKEQDTGRLFVGKPVRLVRFAGTRVPLSLRHNKEDGSFGGFVLLEIEPARFTEFAQTAVRRDDILALVGLDGLTRARRMGGSSTAGDDLRASSLFKELAARDLGETVSASPIDGVRRLFSFRRLRGYPLVVGAAVAEADALATVAERTKWHYLRSAILTGVIALLAALVIRALSRRKRAVAMLVASEETLRAREQEFRSVTESMPQLVWITDAEGNHSYFNQQWIDYTGLSLAQSVGNGWVAAFHPDDQAGAVKRWDDTVAKDEVYEAEYRLRAANGSYRWMLARRAAIARCESPHHEVVRHLDGHRHPGGRSSATARAGEPPESHPRRDHRPRGRRHDQLLEPRGRAHLWVDGRGGARAPPPRYRLCRQCHRRKRPQASGGTRRVER